MEAGGLEFLPGIGGEGELEWALQKTIPYGFPQGNPEVHSQETEGYSLSTNKYFGLTECEGEPEDQLFSVPQSWAGESGA